MLSIRESGYVVLVGITYYGFISKIRNMFENNPLIHLFRFE